MPMPEILATGYSRAFAVSTRLPRILDDGDETPLSGVIEIPFPQDIQPWLRSKARLTFALACGGMHTMERRVHQEILDLLPEDHPVARANRRDILTFNRLMGNFRWIARSLCHVLRSGDRLLDIGAGSGDLAKHLAPLLCAHGAQIDGLDPCTKPKDWPDSGNWHQQKVQDMRSFDQYDILVACHFLHQLQASELRDFGARIPTATRLIVATEPVRHRFYTWCVAATGLIGMRRSSRYDARVSIAAGFRNDELPMLLGLRPEAWTWTISETWRGAYRFRAQRKEKPPHSAASGDSDGTAPQSMIR